MKKNRYMYTLTILKNLKIRKILQKHPSNKNKREKNIRNLKGIEENTL